MAISDVSITAVAVFSTALLGVWGVTRLIASAWARTGGRRRILASRISRLGNSAQVDYFNAVLGTPPRHSSAIEGTDYRDNIWIFPEAVIQAFSDADSTVQAFSVVTRSRRFRPRFRSPRGSGAYLGERRIARWIPSVLKRRLPFWAIQRVEPFFDVRLGITRFAALSSVDSIVLNIGARTLDYIESNYYGNPGHYQTYLFGVNLAGAHSRSASWPYEGWYGFSWPPGPEGEHDDLPDDLKSPCEGALPPGIVAFRKRTRVNAITIIGPHRSTDLAPTIGDRVGPHPDSIRMLN